MYDSIGNLVAGALLVGIIALTVGIGLGWVYVCVKVVKYAWGV